MKISEWNNNEVENVGILTLTRKVFGDQEIAQKSYFDWQYRQNPRGKALVLLVKDEKNDNRVIGSNTIIPIELILDKHEIRSSLACNVQVDPDYRNQGIFSKLLIHMKEYAKKNGITCLYAVPNEKSFNAFIKQGSIKIISLPLLVRPLKPSQYFTSSIGRICKLIDWLWRIKKNENSEIKLFKGEFSEQFETLANKATTRIPIMVKRDIEFLKWRYHKCPTREYQIFVLNENDILRAYVITRITKYEKKTIGVIVDFLVDEQTKNKKKIKELISTALIDLLKNGASIAIATSNNKFLENTILHKAGFFNVPNFLKPESLNFIYSPFIENSSLQKIGKYKNWFFSFGDYDVF